MPNWIANIYDTLKDAETAIEAIDNGVTLHILGFKEGAMQKILVVKSA